MKPFLPFQKNNKYFLIVVISLLYTTAFGQPDYTKQVPSIAINKVFGGTNYDCMINTKVTADGGYIIAGATSSKDGDVFGYRGGNSDVWVLKLDKDKKLAWQRCLGGSSSESGTIVYEVLNGDGSSNGYIVGATTSSANGDVKGYKGGSSDIWIIRLSAQGSILWQRPYGGKSMDELINLKPTPDGGFIIGGNTSSKNGDISGLHGDIDVWLAKINSVGSVVWQKAWGSTGQEKLRDMRVLKDGSVIAVTSTINGALGGDITNFYGGWDYWIIRLDKDGNKTWERTLGGSGGEQPWITIKPTSDGNFILGGGSDSPDGDVIGLNNDFGFWVVKLSEQGKGSIIWQWSDPITGNLYDLKETTDKGFIICGTGSGSEGSGGVFVKLSESGVQQWKKVHPGNNYEPLLIQETTGSNFISFGNTDTAPGYHSPSGYFNWQTVDMLAVMLDPNGNTLWEHAFGGPGEEWHGGGIPTVISQSGLWSNYFDNFFDKNGQLFFSTNTNSPSGDVTGLHYSSRLGYRYDIWFLTFTPGVPSEYVRTSDRMDEDGDFIYKVFPNPTNDIVNFTFTAQQSTETLIEIYNITGAMIRKEKISNVLKGNAYSVKINLDGLASGSYTYLLRNGSSIGKGLLIKTH